jgi:pimeloyl-ACP methyl ester carboxylesterase
LKPAPAPVPAFVFHPGRPGDATWAVLLPGRGGHPRDFERAGIPDAMVRAGFQGEIVGVDAHLAYYVKRTVIARIRDDVVARRPGRMPWLVGVSMGGLGALLYEKTHPGEAAGLVLLAPFLGDNKIIAEIAAAGGLRSWEPGAIAQGDYQRELWLWIKQGGLDRVPVFIGWGTEDRFAAADALLADALPHARRFTAPGGHLWTTWNVVFAGLLDAGALAVGGSIAEEVQP